MRAFQSQVLFWQGFLPVRFWINEKWTFLKCPKSVFENQTQKNTFSLLNSKNIPFYIIFHALHHGCLRFVNPNCMNYDHHLNDVYIRMMGQSMGGSGEFVDNENKIMKKIAKAVLIEK